MNFVFLLEITIDKQRCFSKSPPPFIDGTNEKCVVYASSKQYIKLMVTIMPTDHLVVHAASDGSFLFFLQVH